MLWTLADCGKYSGHGGAAFTRYPDAAPAGAVPAQLVATGPDYADENYYGLLLAGAFQARERILAVTPYFVPDDALLVAWRMACRRGAAPYATPSARTISTCSTPRKPNRPRR